MGTFLKEEVSTGELVQCLEAIARDPKGASDIRLPLGEVYCGRFLGERTVYINFLKPSLVPLGSTYRTWVIRFDGGRPEGVSYFLSRRGGTADDTLPPDD